MDYLDMSVVEEQLRTLRQDRQSIQRKEKLREEEYKKATKQYINSLKKETEALEKSNANYNKRNMSFKEEVNGIQERYKIGEFNLKKSHDRLQHERENINQYLLETFPKLAMQVRERLLKEKEEIDYRIKNLRQENEKNKNKEPELGSPYPSNMAQIKERQVLLEREINEKRKALNMGNYETNVNFLNRFIDANGYRDDKSALDEYVGKPEDILNPRRAFDSVKNVTPQYLRESAKPRSLSQTNYNSGSSVVNPKTDLLSNFYYNIPAPSKTWQSPSNLASYNLTPKYTSTGKGASPMKASLSLNFSPI